MSADATSLCHYCKLGKIDWRSLVNKQKNQYNWEEVHPPLLFEWVDVSDELSTRKPDNLETYAKKCNAV